MLAVQDSARVRAVRAAQLFGTNAEEEFDRLTSLLAELLEAPVAFMTLVDDGHSYWKSTAGLGPLDLTERLHPVHESFCQYVIEDEEMVAVSDATMDARTRTNPSVETLGVRSWLGSPVVSSDGFVLGSFCVADFQPRVWTERHMRILETLAESTSRAVQLRAALERAHVQSLALKEQNAADASMARVLQESLLPPSLPEIAGLDVAAVYTPGKGDVVTGDFYDVFPRKGKTWGIVLGDVCGHGALAAKTTAFARYTVRTLAGRYHSPSKVLNELNDQMLSGDFFEQRLLSAIYLNLRPTSDAFAVSLSNAGHLPALVRRADGTVTQLGSGGRLLGVGPKPPLRDCRTKLHSGDTLVLYTDGITEARGKAGMFGDELLQLHLAQSQADTAEDLVLSLRDAALRHADGFAQDDMAMLAVRVR